MGKFAAIPSIIGGLGSISSVISPITQIASAISGAQGLLGGNKKPRAPSTPSAAQAPPFNPKRPDQLARPGTLNEFSSFTPEQERSALATKGINQGLGKDEDAYYRNLVQRSLIGDDNRPAPDTNSLLPVESQYFSQSGMNTSGIMEFLKQLAGAR